nr:MAG TPA: hypothetical protein [Caudoviricetes sp.]
MTESIIVALVTGGLSLLGVVLTNRQTAKAIDEKLAERQSITETKLTTLTEEVRKHNGFAERIPVVEGSIKLLGERIKVANHRIDDLEKHNAQAH